MADPAPTVQPPVPQASPYQTPGYQAPPYQAPLYPPGMPVRGGNSVAKSIGIGCLIAFAIFLFVGLSCTRACFGMRRSHVLRRY